MTDNLTDNLIGDDLAAVAVPTDGLAVAIQGGAMRSVYCLGAVRALIDEGFAPKVSSIHCVSSGSLSAAALQRGAAGGDLDGIVDELVDRLCNSRMITPWRPGRVFDVDHLLDVIDDVLVLGPGGRLHGPLPIEVTLTETRTGRASYVDLVGLERDERRDALRATMALPHLYWRPVTFQGVSYVDGGICDPLPVLRAVLSGARWVVAIASKQPGRTGEPSVGLAAFLLQLAPNIDRRVKRLMLSRNPLGTLTDTVLDRGSIGTTFLTRITPSRPEWLVSRTERNESRLRRLEELGYNDALTTLRSLA